MLTRTPLIKCISEKLSYWTVSGISLPREWQCNKKPFFMAVTLHFACSEDLEQEFTMCSCLTNVVDFVILCIGGNIGILSNLASVF